jgi:hypothetical protein
VTRCYEQNGFAWPLNGFHIYLTRYIYFPNKREESETRGHGEQTVAVRLPEKYRHMTFDEFIATATKALKQLQERLEKTGSLFG